MGSEMCIRDSFATDGTGGRVYQVRPDGKSGFRMQTLLNKTVRPVAASGIISSPHFPDKYQGNFILLNTIGYLGIKNYQLVHSGQGKDTDGDGFSDDYEMVKKSNPEDSNSKPKGAVGDVWGVRGDLKDSANTCLLYTSPSPRDLSTSRMPSSA